MADFPMLEYSGPWTDIGGVDPLLHPSGAARHPVAQMICPYPPIDARIGRHRRPRVGCLLQNRDEVRTIRLVTADKPQPRPR